MNFTSTVTIPLERYEKITEEISTMGDELSNINRALLDIYNISTPDLLRRWEEVKDSKNRSEIYRLAHSGKL